MTESLSDLSRNGIM